MTLWLAIVGMGLITYAMRASVIALLGRYELRAGLQRALRFVPIAVLSAIIVPEVIAPDGALDVTLANPRLIAALLAAAVAWRTRHVLATIGVGMAALWTLRVLIAVP
jgi:branched-subunit amino acid transport protein